MNLSTRILILISVLGTISCSSGPVDHDSPPLSDRGPLVVFTRSQPGLIEVNRESQPLQPAEIFADVKDFHAKVSEVRLRFSKVPIDVPMQNVSGSTWKAVLTPRQLAQLAVAGQTAMYDARIFARNSDGDVTMSHRPIELAIRAPGTPSQMAGTAARH